MPHIKQSNQKLESIFLRVITFVCFSFGLLGNLKFLIRYLFVSWCEWLEKEYFFVEGLRLVVEVKFEDLNQIVGVFWPVWRLVNAELELFWGKYVDESVNEFGHAFNTDLIKINFH